jgi:hypothetical protein
LVRRLTLDEDSLAFYLPFSAMRNSTPCSRISVPRALGLRSMRLPSYDRR